jgi:geranylgeranyl diphosphate synthase type II
MAILAGDALLTYGLQLLVTPPPSIELELAFKVARIVAQAVGPQGMVGGQADDMLAARQEPGLELLQTIHARKTGALITASLLSGAMLAGANDDLLKLMETYGHKVGLAFQIADDILDVEGNSQEVGKSLGKDSEQGKLTYPALLGMEEAKELGKRLTLEAVELAGQMQSRPLAWLAEYIMERSK